jgi:hypothetical protein
MAKYVGQYYFRLTRGWWKIFKCTEVSENGFAGSSIGESYHKPYDAYVRVCELNGTEPVPENKFAWGRQ